MRRTKEEAEQTKQDILRAALEVFDEKSYDTATLSNIAKKAGVTRGAIYWHFNNKFDILRELMDKYFGQFLNEVYKEISDNNAGPIRTIEILLENYVNNILNNPETLKFRRVVELKISFTEDTEEISELFGKFKAGIREKITIVMKNGQESGEIRTDMSAEFLSVSLMSWIFGYESMTLSPIKSEGIKFECQDILENMVKFIKP